MLSPAQSQAYQQLQKSLLSLQSLLGNDPLDVQQIKQICDRIVVDFQQQIRVDDDVEIIKGEETETLPWQSIQTEMHRQIQLLVTNATFLQITRQKDKQKQQTLQMGDRIHSLLGYCEVILTHK